MCMCVFACVHVCMHVRMYMFKLLVLLSLVVPVDWCLGVCAQHGCLGPVSAQREHLGMDLQTLFYQAVG